MRGTLDARFFSKVHMTDGCWVWTAATNGYGYGQIRIAGRTRRAHRVGYEAMVGPIPVDHDLDHLCRNRLCVRPDHLEPVTRRVNLLRGDTTTARNARVTHCPRGHAYDAENTRVHQGKRTCRECERKRAREYARAHREEARVRYRRWAEKRKAAS